MVKCLTCGKDFILTDDHDSLFCCKPHYRYYKSNVIDKLHSLRERDLVYIKKVIDALYEDSYYVEIKKKV